MANYSQMLGSLAAEKAVGATKSFAKGAKQAFLNETQGISSIAQFAQTAREQISVSNRTLVEQRKNNVISLEMVKELRRVNANISKSNVIAIRTAKAAGLKNATAGIAPTSGGGGAGGGDGGGGGGVTTALIAGAAGGAGASVLTIARAIAGRIIGALLGPAGLFVGGAFALSQFGPRAVSQGMSNRFNTKPAKIASTGTMGSTPQQQSEARAASSGGLNFGIPIGGSGVEYIVTSRYGMRNGKMHKGIDLASKGNKPALAIASEAGKVIEVRSSPTYGNFVKLEHSNGMHTLYAHLGSSSVYSGRKVVKGETLGTIGNTGTVDGPTGIHLHFEVHRGGNQIDPESVINFGGLPVRDEPVKNSDGNQFRAPPDTGTGVKNVLGSFAGPGVRGVSPSSQSASIYDFAPVGANLGAGTQIKTRSLAEQFLAITAKQNVIQTQQLVQANKNLKTLNVTTARAGGIPLAGGSVARRGPPTQDQLRERYYRSQLESARQSFLSVTQRLINTTLLKTFFPRGFGVTRQQSLGMGYVGNLIGNEIGLTNKITGVLSKAFGKQYGQAYGQIFGRLGNVFIDKAANEFSKSIGFNPEDPTKFTFGQILGNFLTKGTKEQRKAGRRMGLEQLVYNYTGIPLGPSSLLSFLSMNPAMAGFRSMMGMTGNPMQYAMNPALALQQMSGAGANYITNPLFAGITGGFNMIPGSSMQMQMMMMGRPTMYQGVRMTTDTANQVRAQEAMYSGALDEQTKTQGGFFDTLGETFTNGFKSFMSIFGLGGGPGGGTPMNFGGGGGGGGGFLDNLMMVGGNLATLYLGNKLFKKTGLSKSSNPLVQIAGNLAMNYLVKSGLQIAANSLGFGDIAGKFLGANTGLADIGGAFLGTLTGASTSGITAATLGELGINTALTVGSTGGPASVVSGITTAAPIVNAGSTTLAGTTAATTGATTAALQAAPGTQAAAGFLEANGVTAGATATEGILAAAAETIPVIAAVYAVYRVINYFAFEKGDTRATYSIIVNGNNNINAGEIVHSEKTQESHWKLVENFGKAGFVMIKKLESQGVKPDFDYFTVQISFNPHRNVQMGFNKGNPGQYDRKMTPINVGPLDLRKPVDANVIKVIMDNMARLIAERMSQTNSKSQAELQATLATITKSESEGNIEGIDSNVFKDAGGRKSYNESIAAKAYELSTTDVSGEGQSVDLLAGKMSVFNAKTGRYETVDVSDGILGYDPAGNPITRASLDATKSSASPVASGTNLTLQQVQNQNEELRNSNPSTATTNAAGNGTAVVNSGNVIDNSNKTTIINQRLYDDNIVQFGAFTGAEYGRVSYNRN